MPWAKQRSWLDGHPAVSCLVYGHTILCAKQRSWLDGHPAVSCLFIWPYYTICFRFLSIGLYVSFLKFSLFWAYSIQTIPVYGVSLPLLLKKSAVYTFFSFLVDISSQMHYDNLIRDLSVKGACRTFRQFLPDFFTHWRKAVRRGRVEGRTEERKRLLNPKEGSFPAACCGEFHCHA